MICTVTNHCSILMVMDNVSVTHFSKYLMIFSASLSVAKIPLPMFSIARAFSLWFNSVLGKKVPTSSTFKSFKNSLLPGGATFRHMICYDTTSR